MKLYCISLFSILSLSSLFGQHTEIRTPATLEANVPALQIIHGKSDFTGIDLRLNDHGVVNTGGDLRFYLDDNESTSPTDGALELYNGSSTQVFSINEDGLIQGKNQILSTSTFSTEPALTLMHNEAGGEGIDLRYDGHGVISSGGDFRFYLDDNEQTSPTFSKFEIYRGDSTEIFTINENPSMIIGNTNARANLLLIGSYEQFGPMTINGNINANGTITANSCDCSSDVRFKQNIQPISDALSLISGIRGVYFDWDNDTWSERNFQEDRQIGFIAQELEKVLPEVVETDDAGYKSVSYNKLTALLIEGIKEQQEEIDQLKAQVAHYRNLEERILKLEKER